MPLVLCVCIYNLTVQDDTQAPQVQVTLSRNPVPVDNSVTIAITAVDDVRVDTVELFVDGRPVTLDARGQARITPDQPGSLQVVGRATDLVGNVGEGTATLRVIDPNDQQAPVIEITSPEDGAVVTHVYRHRRLGHRRQPGRVSRVGGSAGRFLHGDRSGTTPVVNDVLGTFDPTMLSNDTYILQVTALDAGGNRSIVQQEISARGDLKLGDFRLSFVDLELPVNNVPIIVSRTYDTLVANREGDFGYGWQLSVANTDLRTSVALTGLEEDLIFNPLYDGARVYVRQPGGRREGFTFRPRLQGGLSGSFLGLFEPYFEPDDGVTSELTVKHFDLWTDASGNLSVFNSSLSFNPANPALGGNYTLTTRGGMAYEIDGRTGDLEFVSDALGNTLTFTSQGIENSEGYSIEFERDSRGRIAAIADQTGNRITYQYDVSGDLVSVTDREGAVTQFVYHESHRHYLTDVVDPLGRTGARSEYDEQGRLVRIIDAVGNSVQLLHDPENFVETIRRPTGESYDV